MKHQRLETLRNHRQFRVPEFFVFDGDLEAVRELPSEKIIVRSSYDFEDGDSGSFAGIFRSETARRDDPESVRGAVDSILADAKKKLAKIGGDFGRFHVFLQEFIEIESGGVAFLEGSKFYAEISVSGSHGVVNGNSEQTYFRQGDFEIRQGMEILDSKTLANLRKSVTEIHKIFGFDCDVEFGIAESRQICVFQVRPITRSPFEDRRILDDSNIGENYPGEVSALTFSFVRKLYAEVYRSTAYHSGISYIKLAKISNVFDDLVAWKGGIIHYDLAAWYKMLLLFPGNHKAAFDRMIGSSGNINYLVIDDMADVLPSFFYRVKYWCIVIGKIFTFRRNLNVLERYLQNFYGDFFKKDLTVIPLEGLHAMLTGFVRDLSFLWYVTIDNDFLIMKFGKNGNLGEMNGLFSANQVRMLHRLANGEATLESYVETYGHRFGDELKLENPEFDYGSPEFQTILAKYKDLEVETKEASKGGLLRFLINNREKFRIFRSKNFSVARRVFLEIARRLVQK
jgi:pyruvate,water dikinase